MADDLSNICRQTTTFSEHLPTSDLQGKTGTASFSKTNHFHFGRGTHSPKPLLQQQQQQQQEEDCAYICFTGHSSHGGILATVV